MKKLLSLCLLLAGLHAGWSQTALLPAPYEISMQDGVFTLDEKTVIATGSDAQTRQAAILLIQYLHEQTGLSLAVRTVTDFKSVGKSITISIGAPENPNDVFEYTLKISREQAAIQAKTYNGCIQAIQTLRQLAGFDRQRKSIKIPCCKIGDAPAFAYRGVMFDCGRHFMPTDFLKKQIDLLSFYKLNVMRLHLTEDQGWRIEIKKYPELTHTAAWRTEADGTIYGSFYSQDALRDLVDYAAKRGIEIIPEIEMPGHCRAALAAYPDLSCRKQTSSVPADWGVFKDVYCAGQEKTYSFIQDVLDEVIPIFPSKYIHIGGDEVPKDRWKACKVCQSRMQQENLKDEHALQSYFIQSIQKYLTSRGRTLIGWDEILEGGINSDAVVEIWRGMDHAKSALQNGNRVILAPGNYCYFDAPPASLPMSKVYAFNPLTDSAVVGNTRNVWGMEVPLWSERITEANAENMLYPRLFAFAETAWSGQRKKPYSDFHDRVYIHQDILDTMHVVYGAEDRNMSDCSVHYDPATDYWTVSARNGMRDMKNQVINLSEGPQATGSFFDTDLVYTTPIRVQVTPFRKDKPCGLPVVFETTRHLATGKTAVFKAKYDARYAKPGDYGLTDGLLGSADFHDGLWLGWQGHDLDVTIDLGKSTPVKTVTPRFLQASNSWILFPRTVKISVSQDGKAWKEAGMRTLEPDPFADNGTILPLEFELNPGTKTRYIRVNAVCYGKLPEGHNGAGGDAWIFADEVLVR
jgi:hexosaminidase